MRGVKKGNKGVGKKQEDTKKKQPKTTSATAILKGDRHWERQREERKQLSLHLLHLLHCRRLWVCQSIRTTGGHTHYLALWLLHALITLLCMCLQMANLVTSLCCVVLAAVVVAYPRNGEYAFPFLDLLLHFCSKACSASPLCSESLTVSLLLPVNFTLFYTLSSLHCFYFSAHEVVLKIAVCLWIWAVCHLATRSEVKGATV